MQNKQNKKPGFFQSLLCGCQQDESQIQTEKSKSNGVLEEYYDDGQLNKRQSKFSPSKAKIRTQESSLTTSTFIPITKFVFLGSLSHPNIYLNSEFTQILGKNLNPNQKCVSLLSPSLNKVEADKDGVVRLAVRFPHVKNIYGLGIAFPPIVEKNNFCLLSEQDDFEENQLNLTWEPNNKIYNNFGGYFLMFDQNNQQCYFLMQGQSIMNNKQIPFCNAKEILILEYSQHDESLKISTLKETICEAQVEAPINFEANYEPHFAVVLNDIGDMVEILGDPYQNNLDQFTPSMPRDFKDQSFSINRKYKCGEQNKFSSVSVSQMEENIIQFINNPEENEKINLFSEYVLCHFTPGFPFPKDQAYKIKVGFEIVELGSGSLYFGIQRLGYARKNAQQTQKNINQILGTNFIIEHTGKTIFNPRQIFTKENEIKQNDIMIFEYDPIFDRLKVYNQKSPEDFGFMDNLYKGKEQIYFQDAENKYCWVFSGSGNFKVNFLYNLN